MTDQVFLKETNESDELVCIDTMDSQSSVDIIFAPIFFPTVAKGLFHAMHIFCGLSIIWLNLNRATMHHVLCKSTLT